MLCGGQTRVRSLAALDGGDLAELRVTSPVIYRVNDHLGHGCTPLHSQMKRSRIGLFRHLMAPWIAGAVALVLATWVSFLLGLSSATAACVYLVTIVLLSLMDSFITAVIFPVVAVGCLDLFFFKPLFAFEVANPQDLTTLSAFLVTSIVITNLVRRLRRLEQAHREQARLLDLTRDSVLVRDLDNVITYWNRGGEELYGWRREEALGKVAHELLQTSFPAPLEAISQEMLRNGHWEGELLHRRRDGRQVAVSSRWSVQRGDEGQPVGTLETNSDITERKRGRGFAAPGSGILPVGGTTAQPHRKLRLERPERRDLLVGGRLSDF